MAGEFIGRAIEAVAKKHKRTEATESQPKREIARWQSDWSQVLVDVTRDIPGISYPISREIVRDIENKFGIDHDRVDLQKKDSLREGEKWLEVITDNANWESPLSMFIKWEEHRGVDFDIAQELGASSSTMLVYTGRIEKDEFNRRTLIFTREGRARDRRDFDARSVETRIKNVGYYTPQTGVMDLIEVSMSIDEQKRTFYFDQEGEVAKDLKPEGFYESRQ